MTSKREVRLGDLPYTLAELLHETANTLIYRGTWDVNGTRTPVTIKVLNGEHLGPQHVAQLRHEFEITHHLQAEGVIRAYRLEKIGAGAALVLEDFGGAPLHELARSNRLDLKAKLRIGASLAGTLAAVHGQHVIHKDVKPQNILVHPETGQVKLTDFGISTRLSEETQAADRPELLEGTLAYMSPEQTGRMNRVIDSRTDFYSLGVTLYELLAGVLPFQATDPLELVHSHIARVATPLHERSAEIPAAVSDIVQKLMAKSAEDRYQSGTGLEADLNRCLAALEATGRVDSFALGRSDVASELRIPQKLYGREAQTAELLAAFDRVGKGRSELLLIAGHAGVGKSALVNEIHRAITERGGHFGSGKFDQLSRSLPYAPVAAALRQLMRRLLTEPAETLARWKTKLLGAMGRNARILVDLIPELGLIIGPQPDVTPLGPNESQNRFRLVFQNFLRVLTTAGHPVVLFLDDLQWADPASLKLLQLVLTDPAGACLLVIGAYRDQEAAAGQLATSLAELREAGAAAREITLTPLTPADVRHLIADTLGASGERLDALADVVHATSQGNPFFLSQLLKELYAEGILSFDPRAGGWTWETERIHQRRGGRDVLDLMVDRMQRLAPATRQVLELGACIGHQFDLSTLATIHERSPEETAADLWEALREGLVVPLDTHYRLLLASEGSLPGQELQASYRFLHDRVQQAAYSLIPDDRKQEVHLKIGRLIQAQIEGDPSADDLFKVVSHKNRAAARIDDRQEQLELLRFNLAVGRRAKASMAYAAAAEHFQMGMALLGARSWEEDHALSFALHRERAECEWLSGAAAQAQTLIQELLSHAQSRLERAEVYSLRLAVHTLLGEFAEVLRIGRESVALFGVELPETPEQTYAALGAALAEVPANLAGRRIEQLVDAPWVGDADQLAILRLLAAMLPGTYTLDPTLLGLIAVIQVNLSLKYGNSPAAAFAYGMYCLLLAGAMGRYDEAREFQKVSLQLNERPDGVELQCKVYVVCGAPAHFFESTRAALMCLARGQQAGLTSGDFSFASYCCLNITVMKLSAGDALGPLGEEVRDFLALMQRTKDPFTTPVLVLAKQMLASLTGSTSGPQSLSDAAFDEAAFVAGLAPALQLARCWYYVNKLVLAVLYGDHAGALSMAAQADALGASAMSQFFLNDIPFYASLALLALCDTATEEVRARHIEAAEDHRAKLTIWAQHAPENYAHKERLVGAEMARVRGHDAEAAALYDQAIVAARASGFTHQEALAGELCARFYLRKGRETIAQWYLVDAHRAYGRWGATAKAEHLAREHARLLEGVSTEEPRTRVLATTVTRRGSTEAFDVATVVRAMQAVASENVLDKLLDRLMRSLITNAGAQRGVLILAREGELVIEASMRVDPDTVETGLSIPALASQDIATSVVQLVARTREPVVLNDARQDSRFAGDAYIAARQPRSILCLAMTHQGRLAGILYLENNVTQGAFTPGRVEVCGLLASQAAIALENALLIASIREGTRALRDSNEQLQRELELRAASEAERELLQQEIMRLQTPIIPITDEVLVMPLVGALDAGRAQQVLETALTGVKNRRAKVVILDITGVVGVDAGVAAALINTARALQLLGAKAVLSGIRPEVAVSLVQLDVQLGSIVTMSTLQSGIAYALGPGGLQGSFRR